MVGGRSIVIEDYNQETPSRMEIQRIYNKVQTVTLRNRKAGLEFDRKHLDDKR